MEVGGRAREIWYGLRCVCGPRLPVGVRPWVLRRTLPTPAPGWTIAHQIAHLAAADANVLIALRTPSARS
ncbi:maleylpyruvate isomerase N-terminal domain-containing protein [Streptomyces acidiscabies]|uniref:maleylpyruvate isomerase N-terminal domain-containing protein n=1 Tax=Streptomyces acidiscabies TaxID=42234 RepID=UPI0038F810FB